jgi:hypothetical protein
VNTLFVEDSSALPLGPLRAERMLVAGEEHRRDYAVTVRIEGDSQVSLPPDALRGRTGSS